MTAGTLELVPRGQIPSLWPKIVLDIARAMKGDDEQTPDDVREGLVSGRLQLLLASAEKALVGLVVVIVVFHRIKVMRVVYAFGRGMQRVREAITEQFEAWARAQGCKYAEGWVQSASRERLFNRFGYSRKYAIVRKAL